MEPSRLFDLVDFTYKNLPLKEDILAGKYYGEWRKFSTLTLSEYVNYISCALLSFGLQQDDKIITIVNNRPEWMIIDMSIMQIGCIHIPVYPTISREDYKYIFNHCQPVVVIVGDKTIYERVKPLLNISSIKYVIALGDISNTLSWEKVLEMGKEKIKEYSKLLIDIKKKIQPDDVATIIYTSGTTGDPKGVMLTHENILSNVKATANVHPLGSENKALSFLPLSHVYERMLNYHYLYKGISIYYAENMGTIADDLKEVKPEIFCAVPRIFELFFEKIQTNGHDLPFPLRWIFFHAIRMGINYEFDRKYNLFKRLHLKLLDILVYKKIRESLGGNLKIVVSGGASLQPRLARFFWAIGIKLLEGYGLSETSPVIAVNQLCPQQRVKIGTVGPILEGVKVKIAPDGEILCKGPNVMK